MPSFQGLRGLLTDRSFWIGLFAIAGGLLLFLLLVNFAVMPIWTRHSAAVPVPSVRNMSAIEAETRLRLAGLAGEMEEQPFNPSLEPDVVVDQSPAAGATVKPGRRVYYYINASPRELVAMPSVVGRSQGQAAPAIEQAGLEVGEVRYDTTRSPYENTVVRQMPAAGRQVPRGTRVSIWLSPGPDRSRRVRVPDVVGLPVDQARRRLQQAGLWVDSPRARSGRVVRQDPAAGATKSAGEEVTIVTDGADPAPPRRPAPESPQSDSSDG